MADNTTSVYQRRGDGGGKVSPELALFFNELDRLNLGYTITSTTRNKDTHPDKYSETSPHFTGNAFDLGYKNENDNLGLLKYLFGEDFDPKAKVDGDYVRPDLTPEGEALFKRHNVRMIDERSLVDNEHFHFEAVDSTKAKKINKTWDGATFDSSPRKGKRYASDTEDFYFYGGAVGEFTENELNTNQNYKDSIPDGDYVIIGDSLQEGKMVPFTWTEVVDEETRNAFNSVLDYSQDEAGETTKEQQDVLAGAETPDKIDPSTGEIIEITDESPQKTETITVNGIEMSKEEWERNKIAQTETYDNEQHKNVGLDGGVTVEDQDGNFVPEGTGYTTSFVLPSAEQALENSKNPEYVAALEKQGYTVEQYLKDPQGTLNEISKKSDLESNLEEAPAPPIFSMGVESKTEVSYQDIEEVEEDDKFEFVVDDEEDVVESDDETTETTDDETTETTDDETTETTGGGYGTAGIETTETSEKFTHEDKQVEANANNPEYVEKLEARGFTVQEYLENPQNVLDELSRLSDLDQSVSDENIELTTSQGDKKKKVQEYEEIEEIEEDDLWPDPVVMHYLKKYYPEDYEGVLETRRKNEKAEPSRLINELEKLQGSAEFTPPENRIYIDPNETAPPSGLDRGGTYLQQVKNPTYKPLVILSQEDIDYIDKTNKELEAISSGDFQASASTDQILSKLDHEKALKLVESHDKKSLNSALAHLTSTHNQIFETKEDWLNFAKENNIDGENAFQLATPSDTEDVANARGLLARNREIFNEVFSMSKYAGSHLNKIVALFGGHDSESLDFGIIAKDMEAAALLFMSGDEINQMQSKTGLDLNINKKNQIIFKAKMYTLDKYAKSVEDVGCDLENDINIYNDDEKKLLDDKEDYEGELAELNLIKRRMADNTDFEYNPDGTERVVGYKDEDLVKELGKEIDSRLPGIEKTRLDLLNRYEDLENRRGGLEVRQTDLKNEYEEVFSLLNFNGVSFDPHNFNLEKEFKAWENGLKHIPVIGHAVNIGLGYLNARWTLSASEKSWNLLARNPWATLAAATVYKTLGDIERYEGGYGPQSWITDYALEIIAPSKGILPYDRDALVWKNNPNFQKVGEGGLKEFFSWDNLRADNPGDFAYHTLHTLANAYSYVQMLAKAKINVKEVARNKRIGKGDMRYNVNKVGMNWASRLSYKVKGSEWVARSVAQAKRNQKLLFFENWADGKARGLSNEQAFMYGQATTLATGIAQSIIPEYRLFATTFGKNAQNTLVKGLKSVKKGNLKDLARWQKTVWPSFKSMIPDMIGEVGEEVLDMKLNDVVRGAYLTNYSPEIQDANAVGQMLTSTFILTGSLGLGKGRRQMRQMQQSVYSHMQKLGVKAYQEVNDQIDSIQSAMDNIEDKRTKKGRELKKLFLEEIKQLEATKNQLAIIMQAQGKLSKYSTVEEVNLMIKKNKLLKEKQGLDNNSEGAQKIQEKINKINEQLKNTGSVKVGIEMMERGISNLQKLFGVSEEDARNGSIIILDEEDYDNASEQRDLQIQKINDEVDAQIEAINKEIQELTDAEKSIKHKDKKNGSKIKKLQEDRRALAASRNNLLSGSKSPGFFYKDEKTGKFFFVINKSAAEKAGNYFVAGHEGFHALLFQTSKTKQGRKIIKAMGFALLNKLNEVYAGIDPAYNYVAAKFKAGMDSGAYINKKTGEIEWEEVLTIFSEALAQGDIEGKHFNNAFLNKITTIFRRMARETGLNWKIKGAQDVIAFIKDYNREFIRGRFSRGMQKIRKNGLVKVDPEFVRKNKKGADIQEQAYRQEVGIEGSIAVEQDPIEEGKKSIEFTRDVGDELSVVEEGDFEDFTEDEKFVRDLALGYTKESWEAQGADNAAKIIQQMEIFDRLIAAKLKVARSPEETKDFVKRVYSALYSDILGFNPEENNDLFGYLNSRVRFRAGDIYNEEQKGKIQDRTGEDIGDMKDIQDIEGDSDVDNVQDEELDPKVHVGKRLGLVDEITKVITRGLELIRTGPVLNKDGTINEKKEQERLNELNELGFIDGEGKIIDLATSYKNMPNILYKVIAKRFGVDPEKLSPYIKKPFSKNLRRQDQRGSNELLNAQMALRKIGMEALAAILPEGHTSTYEATGIAGTKYKVFYNKGKRVGNNYIWHKKPVIDVNMLENMLGIVDKKSFREDRLAQQSVISMLNILGTVATIQTVVEVSKQTGDLSDLIRANMEDGKSKMAQSIWFVRHATTGQRATVRERLPIINEEIELIEDRYEGDELVKRIKGIFKNVFGDSLVGVDEDGKRINGAIEMANQLFGATGFLTQYGIIKANYEIMGMEVPRGLDKFIQDNLQSKEKNDIDIFAAFGMTGPNGETLTKDAAFTKKGIKNGRKNLVEKIKAIDKLVEEDKLTEKEGYEWIFMMKAMYAGAGVLGDNTYMPKSDGSYVIVRSNKPRGKEKIPGLTTKQYAQVATSSSDYAALVNRANTRFKIGDVKYNNKVKKKFEIESNFEESSKAVIEEIEKGTFDFESRKEQAMRARRLITFMVELATERYNNQEDLYNEMDVVQELFMFGSSMESVSRKAAHVYGMAEGLMVNGKYTGDISKVGQDLEYDHLVPHHQLMLRIANIVKNGDVKSVEKSLENIFEEFVVNIIPKKMDKVVTKMGMQYLMQENYQEGRKLGDLKGAFGRMYGEKTLGDSELKIITSLDGKKTEHGKDHVRFQDETAAAVASKKSISFTRAIRKVNEMAINNEVMGISIWDFDDTLARTNSKVIFVAPDGTRGKLTAEEFASKGAQLLEQGYVYDFSEFDKVIDGTPGPFLPKFINRIKKFGIKDNFILTARPENSAASIQLFLKELGIDIPIENITGLANSTPEAKALWIVDKVGEGYNDIYFADDALQNVQVVKNVLDQFDVKSKVRQAKGKQSIDFSRRFNQMIERKTGIDAEKRFSKTKAEKRGFNKGRFKLWIAPSAEDFAGLLYNFLGIGEQGNKDWAFLEEVLLRPYARAYNKLNTAKQQARNEYKKLLKKSGLKKKLKELILKGDYIVEDAVRVYLWNKAGYKVPGLSETDLVELINVVEGDSELKAFADSVGLISRTNEGYVEPTNDWVTQGISYDINRKGNEARRQDYLSEFMENRRLLFGEWNERGELVGENMNKIEAAFGKGVREALQDVLWRMENGTNRNIGQNKMVNNFMDYINGSIGATMFFNARSAVLQTISAVNFINWEDNNIFNAAAAFANQAQYWEDFSFLFNSDMLRQRRSGMQQDLNAAELMQSVSRSKGFAGKTNAAIKFILQKGFLPTQMADSFAIASGGATFYRNRINKYLSQGMSESEAKEKAFVDFQEIAEKTQQSARPDLISQEQASVLGRLVLAFQNTPMQYARIQKKAFLDLINGRGDAKSNISKILYYGFAQNIIFYSLQSALFALPFLDDEEEEDFLKGKKERMLNNMLDGSLRGIGVYGAAVSTIKNMVLRFNKEAEKGGRADYEYVVLEFANFSPPVGIKLRKMYNALQTYKFNRDEIQDGEWMLGAEAITGVVEAGTNIPLNRTINKVNNLSESLNSQNAIWQRIAMVLGWNRWDVGLNRRRKESDTGFDTFDDDMEFDTFEEMEFDTFEEEMEFDTFD